MESKAKRLDLSRSETEMFISYYLSQECLWNVRNPSYSKRDKRQAALSMIVQQMACHDREMTVEQVSSKIASLRTYYGRELRKVNISEKSGSAADDVYQSTWDFFPLLDPILRSQVQQRPSLNNMTSSTSTGLPVNENQGTFTSGSHSSEQSSSMTQQNSESLVTQDASDNSTSIEATGRVAQSKKRKSSAECQDVQSLMLKTLQSIEMRKQNKNDMYNDADMLFGQQIGLELKKVDSFKKKQELKLKIQTLIFEYQFENEA